MEKNWNFSQTYFEVNKNLGQNLGNKNFTFKFWIKSVKILIEIDTNFIQKLKKKKKSILY